ncbi:MAG: phosphotransferase [Candidatus Amulumruptor caecigallinarius]|nr:phosphotransferase [Candidatus Amulumruptor caecigallinarius]MCM1395926.1 phosphotransferase [Candidatus Amulumruptor caecigallinarius]MCM1452961.1 phosphotransferase [bacterium]
MTETEIRERIAAAFPKTGEAAVTLLPQAGSDRRYGRLTMADGTSMIATFSPNREENDAFIYLSDKLAEAGVNVPQVIAVGPDHEVYLQTDLGDTSLYETLAGARESGIYGSEDMELLTATMRALAHIHWCASPHINFHKCYPSEAMGRREIMWDLNYFKYCYLRPLVANLNEPALEDDFERLAERNMTAMERQSTPTFMLRDCQSRNVMVTPKGPAFIDFQGGRRGSYLYDLASFLWQGRAKYPEDVREALINEYFAEAAKLQPYFASEECVTQARETLPDILLLRRLQTLGAYGFRGSIERKPQFMAGAPGVVDAILSDDVITARYPAVAKALRESVKGSQKPEQSAEGLTVTVTSFSYRKCYPEDASGNGGGFIFDCRALHNPGRYDRYKQLTGMDEPVIEFLEAQGEVEPFIAHAEALVDAAVDKYLSRGFTSLSVGFGCTGGRHRSVYSAERLARHLAKRGDINVRLIHREQGVDRML